VDHPPAKAMLEGEMIDRGRLTVPIRYLITKKYILFFYLSFMPFFLFFNKKYFLIIK
jgi:hypothetical protein